MLKPKALFFDIGNVLVKLRTEDFLARMAQVCDPRWDRAAILAVIREAQGPHIDYEKGLIKGEAFHSHLGERFGLSVDYPQWLGIWNDYFEPNRPMEALLARLHGQARFFTLSNTNPEHLDHLKRNFRLFEQFEQVLASHELGARKPDPAIFAAALKKAGVSAEEAFYLDDVKAFTDVAQGLGWQSFHYTFNDAELRQTLLELGFTLPSLEGRSGLAC